MWTGAKSVMRTDFALVGPHIANGANEIAGEAGRTGAESVLKACARETPSAGTANCEAVLMLMFIECASGLVTSGRVDSGCAAAQNPSRE